MSRHRGRRVKGAAVPAIPAPPMRSGAAPAAGRRSRRWAPPGAVQTLAPVTAPPVTVPPPVVPRPRSASSLTGGVNARQPGVSSAASTCVAAPSSGGVVVAVAAVVVGLLVTTGGGKKPRSWPPVRRTAVRSTPSCSRSHLPAPPRSRASCSPTTAHGQGQFVLVPSDILTEVAGRGAMQLGQAATFGVTVPAETLSDMIDVTIDGSWLLTPTALGALVDHLGGITVDVSTDVTVNGQVVLSAGAGQHLGGSQASALATYIAADEPSGARLARFESVMVAIMAKLGPDTAAVDATLAALGAGSTSAATRRSSDRSWPASSPTPRARTSTTPTCRPRSSTPTTRRSSSPSTAPATAPWSRRPSPGRSRAVRSRGATGSSSSTAPASWASGRAPASGSSPTAWSSSGRPTSPASATRTSRRSC